jgi:hypothetical protein
LSKCEFYGFGGTTNALLRSYLIGRYQRVLIDNSYSNNTAISEWGKIKHSILQGSVLDPLFFLLNINDIPNIIADLSKPVVFAFDTSIIIAIPSLSKFKEDIKNIIDNVNDWFKVNSSLRFDKTYLVQFMTNNSHEINIKINRLRRLKILDFLN